MRFATLMILGLCIAGGLLCAGGCDREEATEGAFVLEDAPIDPFRVILLETAFEAGSAMPIEPHIKNRSRVQESVVAALLELDQPQRALRYVERIENWRRGTAYADLAFHCARKGAKAAEVQAWLEEAIEISERAEDWRKDRIRSKVAKARACLGQMEMAVSLEEGLEASESGQVARAEAMICSAEEFDEQMEALDEVVRAGQFEAVRNALGAYAELFNRFYSDVRRRTVIVEKIRSAWGNLPILVRIEVLTQLVDFALAHGDQATALGLADEAQTLVDAMPTAPRFEIPLRADLARMRYRAGDADGAQRSATKGLELFDAKRELIVSIDRAGMLRSIAEAYHAMGEAPMSLELYRRALEAGVENPNSRPQAEDLAATCCSMAVHGVEPDAGLWKRIGEIKDGLGEPW